MPARHPKIQNKKPRVSVRREARLKNKRREARQEARPKLRLPKLKKVLLALILITAPFFYISRTTRYWDGVHKLAVASTAENGDVRVSIYDPRASAISVIDIPGSTEVDVSHQLGKWRAKAVSKLGEKEGYEGALLAETLTKHFRFPVFAWASGGGEFAEGGLGHLISAVFTPYKTNLGFGDRVRLAYFSFGVKNFRRETVELADSAYLKSATLSDGDLGYQLNGQIPAGLLALFSEPEFSSVSAKAKIVNRGGNDFLGSAIGEIVEVVGLKVVSIERETAEQTDCGVYGKNPEAVRMFERIFGCSQTTGGETGYDVVIILGKDFEKRF